MKVFETQKGRKVTFFSARAAQIDAEFSIGSKIRMDVCDLMTFESRTLVLSDIDLLSKTSAGLIDMCVTAIIWQENKSWKDANLINREGRVTVFTSSHHHVSLCCN